MNHVLINILLPNYFAIFVKFSKNTAKTVVTLESVTVFNQTSELGFPIFFFLQNQKLGLTVKL